jgi:GAF domain-containing protein
VAAAFSSRLQRRIRRFIDRNLYVNRYDYQSQWFRLTRTLDPSQGEEKLLESAMALLKEVFFAEDVTIALRDDNTGAIRPVLGRGCVRTSLTLDEEGPLGRRLIRDQRALLLDRRVGDFEYLPIYVENQEWLEATASRAVAPLTAGGELLGVVGLTHREGEKDFNYEDLELLDRITCHLAGVLRGIRLGREMAGRREAELLARISDLRERPAGTRELIDMNALTRRALEELRIRASSELEIQVDLAAESRVPGDAALLRRVLNTLLRNAAEAMDGQGVLTIGTRDFRGRDNGLHFVLTVADTGHGMKPDAEHQGRLHAQTVYAQQVHSLGMKPLSAQIDWGRADGQPWPNGLDLGLFQTRSIIRAHEGEMEVDNRNGTGTSVTLRLKAVPAPSVSQTERPQGPPDSQGRREQHAS